MQIQYGIILCSALALFGCVKKEPVTPAKSSQESKSVSLKPLGDAQRVNTADSNATLLTKIKAGLIELTNLGDPNIEDVYQRIDALQAQGRASTDELLAVYSLIEQHKGRLISSKAQAEAEEPSDLKQQIQQRIFANSQNSPSGAVSSDATVHDLSGGDEDLKRIYADIDRYKASHNISDEQVAKMKAAVAEQYKRSPQ